MPRFSGAGVSEVGLRRDHHGDSAFVGPYVALVADGVGDAAAEEIAGGIDNVTCVVLDGPVVLGDGQLLGAVREVANVVDPGAVRRG